MLPLVSNGSANLSFKIRWNGIHLVYCASVVPDLAHYLGLIPATNFPVAVHADVPAGPMIPGELNRPPNDLRISCGLSCSRRHQLTFRSAFRSRPSRSEFVAATF